MTKIKEGGTWKTVNVSYERTDVTISANGAFNLLTHLNDAGKSTGTRPQLVNITVSNSYVYSANSTAALDIGNLSAVGGIPHRVRILVKDDGNIIGMSGTAGAAGNNTSVGTDGGNGGDAIKTKDGVELYIENYGTIAGGGGGGGGGGYPVTSSNNAGFSVTESGGGGAGGTGAGWNTDAILASGQSGSNASTALGIHGGNGGNLGQLGIAAGGYNDDSDSGQNVANPGTNYCQYAESGNGGTPGSAIKGYDASRVTFINTGSVLGDGAFKLKA